MTEDDIGEEIRKKECGDNYFKQWNKVSKEVDCICPENLTEVNDRCLTEDEAKKEDEVKKKAEDEKGNITLPSGATQKELSTYCDKKLPGSVSIDGECKCPKGKKWLSLIKKCVYYDPASKTYSENKKKSSDANKTTEIGRRQIIYRIKGFGFVPHYGGGSFEPTGHYDVLVTLEEPSTNDYNEEEHIQSILDKLKDNHNSDICNAGAGAFPSGSRPPAIWEEFDVDILRGPASDLSGVKLEKTWKSKGSDGPSVGKLKKGMGCNK